MSTTFVVRTTNGTETEIARRVGTEGGVRIDWLNDLADLVHDNATVIAIDNTQQGVETMKDLRELDKETDLQEATSNMQECKDHIRKLRDELEDLDSRKDFWREQAEGLETELNRANREIESTDDMNKDLSEQLDHCSDEVDFWKSQANRVENERMSETQIATREKEFNDELQEHVQELRDEIDIIKRREQHLLECLRREQQENLDLVRENRKFERDLREARWDVVETKNFTVTFFNETFEDGRGGCFEHNTRGEDVSGGLWFGTDFNGELRLRDYDGIGFLPMEVAEAVRKKGYSVANTISTDADQ